MATIKDVAAHAGVSFKTVSRVINRHPHVTDAVRQKVLRAIEDLDYRPNIVARNMRTRKTEYIGLITDQIMTTPFSGAIIKGAQEAAWTNGIMLLTVNTDGQPELEAAAVNMLLERQVAGIAYATMFHKAVAPPAKLTEAPCILVDCFSANGELPAIVPDEKQGGYDATRHLLSRGHRRIAMINGKRGYPGTEGRLNGYRKALEGADLAFDEELVRFGDWWQEDGYHHACCLMKLHDPPTAICCGNDRIAMGVYAAVHELGAAIPDDVAVIGFDNMEVIAAHLRPGLTTMALPYYEMGQRAIEYLTGDRCDDLQNGRRIELPCLLIQREST